MNETQQMPKSDQYNTQRHDRFCENNEMTEMKSSQNNSYDRRGRYENPYHCLETSSLPLTLMLPSRLAEGFSPEKQMPEIQHCSEMTAVVTGG
jgi:hypothetical protein